jgi:hypothetical protein
MSTLPFFIICLHVMAGVFWAGTAFTMARAGENAALHAKLKKPQLGAAAVAILTGGYLWHTFHAGPVSAVERSLGIGAVAALLALGLQIVGALKPAHAHKMQARSAILMAVTVIGMAGARYAGVF